MYNWKSKHKYVLIVWHESLPVPNGSPLKGRIVQPPKTGLKCTSAAAPTWQQTVACQSCPLNTKATPGVEPSNSKINAFHLYTRSGVETIIGMGEHLLGIEPTNSMINTTDQSERQGHGEKQMISVSMALNSLGSRV